MHESTEGRKSEYQGGRDDGQPTRGFVIFVRPLVSRAFIYRAEVGSHQLTSSGSRPTQRS